MPFERWLHFLKFGEYYESGMWTLTDDLKQEEGIEMALDAMKKACARDEVREMIDLRMKARRDEATRLEWALRQGEEAGEARGKSIGEVIGEERGGRIAAMKMMAQGMDRETVLRALDLPQDSTLP